MSVYNNASHLALAIESILAQTVTDFEFMIVNDGSRDESGAIIDRYAAADSRIVAIHQPNRGLVASLNHMLAIAQAPLVARMDGDDIAEPTRFAAQLAFLDAHPDYGVIGTWTSDIDEHGAPYTMDGPDHPTSHDAFLAGIGNGPLLCHPSVIMRRDLVRAVGGYHGAFKHCEDLDLWLRLATRTKLCSLPERLVRYRHWRNQVSTRHAYAQQVGAAISHLAYRERLGGRPDPTETLETLPPLDELDALFGRDGVARQVRATVAPTMLHATSALKAEGYPLLIDYVREGGATPGLWRTVARLAKLGEPGRAIGLAAALAAR